MPKQAPSNAPVLQAGVVMSLGFQKQIPRLILRKASDNPVELGDPWRASLPILTPCVFPSLYKIFLGSWWAVRGLSFSHSHTRLVRNQTCFPTSPRRLQHRDLTAEICPKQFRTEISCKSMSHIILFSKLCVRQEKPKLQQTIDVWVHKWGNLYLFLWSLLYVLKISQFYKA